MTTKAQRAAQARYDQTRPAPVPVRMNQAELERLDAQRQPGEGRGPALLRLAGIRKEEKMRTIEIWEEAGAKKFAPKNVERGEEIFFAPGATPDQAIEAAWVAYEAGKVSLIDLSSGAYWE